MSVLDVFEKQLVGQHDQSGVLRKWKNRRSGQGSKTDHIYMFTQCTNNRLEGQCRKQDSELGSYCMNPCDR